MLQNVLVAFHDAVSLLLRHQVEKRSVLENLDLVVLALDETVDDGYVLPRDKSQFNGCRILIVAIPSCYSACLPPFLFHAFASPSTCFLLLACLI